MYEHVSHSLLNEVLDEIDAPVERGQRAFYTRLGANFYAICSLFDLLYGRRDDAEEKLRGLVRTLVRAALARPEPLRAQDRERERDGRWFLDQRWVGMALYTDGFARDLAGVEARLPYLQELGVDVVHLMPMLKCPPGASDGGYAVSDFRDIDARCGTLDELVALADHMRARGMLLVLDVVLNHTSDEHEWARRARAGEARYRDYYHVFDDRVIPDQFEESMPEVFPETSPGNFTWDEEMGKWVMTVFNDFQWDLDYSNPDVFIEMLDVVLFWANRGADVLRLDAVAFLWKQIGTSCQNLREAHLVLQLMKDCGQVVAPGVLFIAEAIVAPVEVTKYFGEDAVIAKECDIAYNATLMALLWDGVATRNAKLLNRGIRSLPDKLDGATWLNYARCHDDIGLGFDDADVVAVGYEPGPHRRFLVDWFTGVFPESPARGAPFGRNEKTGDARISGSLAALAGLQSALEADDADAIDEAVRVILLLHAVILSFGGIPLLYYGDEVGTLNDMSYLGEDSKARDSRWMHRPRIDWEKVERRHVQGSVEQRIFDGLRRMIEVRKATAAFADLNNREVLEVSDDHLFAFLRTRPDNPADAVLVVANFDTAPRELDLAELRNRGRFGVAPLVDLLTGEEPQTRGARTIVVPGRTSLWLDPLGG